ncbi:MAG: flippase-like domain-containing protein [Chitinophagales bacterium]|nr:flippase-like domain-containing protein [Chitinophagales bacterium]
MLKHLRTIAGITVSVVLLWLTIQHSGLQFNQLKPTIASTLLLGAGMGVFAFSVWVHAQRCKLFWINSLSQANEIKPWSSSLIGNFYNSVLPGNVGEGIRAWHFSRKNKVPFTRALAMMIAEKFLDAQVFFVTVALILPMQRFEITNPVFVGLLAIMAAVVVANIALWWLWPRRSWVKWFIKWIPARGARQFFWLLWLHFRQHLIHLKATGLLFYFFAATGLLFTTNIFQYNFALQAADLPYPFTGFYASWLISSLMIVIFVVPSAPSNVGVVHYGIFMALLALAEVFQINITDGLKQKFGLAGVYLHLGYLIPELVLGAFAVWNERQLLFQRKVDK